MAFRDTWAALSSDSPRALSLSLLLMSCEGLCLLVPESGLVHTVYIQFPRVGWPGSREKALGLVSWGLDHEAASGREAMQLKSRDVLPDLDCYRASTHTVDAIVGDSFGTASR